MIISTSVINAIRTLEANGEVSLIVPDDGSVDLGELVAEKGRQLKAYLDGFR